MSFRYFWEAASPYVGVRALVFPIFGHFGYFGCLIAGFYSVGRRLGIMS